MEKECYEEEVQLYRKTDYKPIIYNKDVIALTPVQKMTVKDLQQMNRQVIVHVTNAGYRIVNIMASTEKLNVFT